MWRKLVAERRFVIELVAADPAEDRGMVAEPLDGGFPLAEIGLQGGLGACARFHTRFPGGANARAKRLDRQMGNSAVVMMPTSSQAS